MDEELEKASTCKVGGNPKGIVMLCLVCGYEWNHDFGDTGTICPLCASRHLVDSDLFRDEMISKHYGTELDG
jgi:predicted Zn-ribbon and HTH transcriptional regulator